MSVNVLYCQLCHYNKHPDLFEYLESNHRVPDTVCKDCKYNRTCIVKNFMNHIIAGSKRCKICNKIKDIYDYGLSRHKHRVRSICKACRSTSFVGNKRDEIEKFVRLEDAEQEKMMNNNPNTMYKVCSYCRESRSLASYRKKKSGKYNKTCNLCIDQAQYRNKQKRSKKKKRI